MEINKFNELELPENIQKGLEDMGFSEMTPIQAAVIPLILEGKDVVAQAPTGTGKTCAFGVPALTTLDMTRADVQVLILCPTRELVMQTADELGKVGKYQKGLKILPIYGGQNIDRQLFGLRKHPQVIVGTPGRILDHLGRRTLDIKSVRLLVLDESDEMLNMGFREDIDKILETVPRERQTVLFSATMPREILQISASYQIKPISVRTKFREQDVPDIKQYVVHLVEQQKIPTMLKIMDDKAYKLVLVFCATKRRTEQLSEILQACHIQAESIHGDLTQRQRDKVMRMYRGGLLRVLVATDVAARGIDVNNIEAIFNFDLPNDQEYYVHRIGRTARANKTGAAYSFATPDKAQDIRNYERFTKTIMEKVESCTTIKGKGIDDEKLNHALRNIKTDNNDTKRVIHQKIDDFNDAYDKRITADDVLCTLLATSEFPMLSPIPEQKKKKGERRGSDSFRRSTDSTRFFMGVGARDNLSEDLLKRYVTSETTIAMNEIVDVQVLDTFSFVEVKNEVKEDMEQLDGVKFNSRTLHVEVAGARERKPEGQRSFGGKPSFGAPRSSGFGGKFDGKKPNSFGRKPSFAPRKTPSGQ